VPLHIPHLSIVPRQLVLTGHPGVLATEQSKVVGVTVLTTVVVTGIVVLVVAITTTVGTGMLVVEVLTVGLVVTGKLVEVVTAA